MGLPVEEKTKFLSAKVGETDFKSEFRIHQTGLDTVKPGRSLILTCEVYYGSCDGPRKVHWFRQSEESAAEVLYSSGGSSDQCERKTTDSQTNSCVYNLNIHNVSSEQTGTYYCAVAACGQVLFGNGTRVKVQDGADWVFYILVSALVLASVLVGVLGFLLIVAKKKYSILSKEMHKFRAFTSTSSKEEVPEPDTEDVHYTALSINPSNRRQRKTVNTDCVYSSVQLHQ
ncbi:hypothetical protein WMY93_017270 [Mugilogobius chulae]|uniref:Ig-like domain-containing protein n=1 Tax=Mugilogobius chulae TaxID=88201 RepID=A0AAW0NNX5_9GOBI